MCDCFHVVLPTWPGAPGSVSGRQLQPQEPEAETEEDHSVTEGPAGEIIRPRPQGSSPVYEYTAESSGFGAQADTPGRRTSSGRRRSWWKRDSGDSTAFSSMSHSESVQEATEVILKTEVEAGVSGYSVTGGGTQGIFVKQVLKDSSAAKLFSLREGDQVISATIFFDHIKYEDALKILQYSEPYKVQFQIKRKLPGSEAEEEWAVSHPQRGPKGQKQQDKDVADGCMETPTKTLEADGDQERLISKPREGRGRWSQDRLSWPKFQAIRSKRGPGPRRSHSSSEASEHRDVPDVSSISTDTEAPLHAEQRDQKAGPGSQRKRFLNLRFGMGTGQTTMTTGRSSREAQGRQGPAGVLEESQLGEDSPQDVALAVGDRKKDRAQEPKAMRDLNVQRTVDPSHPELGQGVPGDGPSRTDRHQRKMKQTKAKEEAALGMSGEDEWEGVQSLEIGISKLSLRDKGEEDSTQKKETEVPKSEMHKPLFEFYKEKPLETEREKEERKSTRCGSPETQRTRDSAEWGGEPIGQVPEGDRRMHRIRESKKEEDQQEAEKDTQRGQVKIKLPKFKRPSFGWSPTRDIHAGRAKQSQASENWTGEDGKEENSEDKRHPEEGHTKTHKKTDSVIKEDRKEVGKKLTEGDQFKMPKVALKGPQVTLKGARVDMKGPKGGVRTSDMDMSVPGVEVDIKTPSVKLEGDLNQAEKDLTTKDGKFKMPKFKMPSFGMAAPGKSLEGLVEVVAPKMETHVTLPTVQGELKTPDISIQLPSTELEVKTGRAGVKLREGEIPEVELPTVEAGDAQKGHLPGVEIPSLKMPKVDLKGPQVDRKGLKVDVKGREVDLKGPKLDMKGPRDMVSASDMEMSVPGVEVDIQAPSVKLEGDLTLAEKELTTRDSKFKMPKFKMPSFGVSAAGKSLEASLEVEAPKMETDVTLPAVQGELKTTDLSIRPPSTELEVKAGHVGVKQPEGEIPEAELSTLEAGPGLKGHLPRVQMPSLKMPKVDLKRPQVDLKGSKVDMRDHSREVRAPELEMSVPDVEADIQAPSVQLKGDIPLAEKDLTSKDGKFKMPKFKMPSFGMSAPGKSLEASGKVVVPKTETDVTLPAVQGEFKTPDLSIRLPSTELEVSLPGMEKDIQAPSAQLEGDPDLAEKDLTFTDSKFKMPKFKMPSFGMAAPGKSLEASGEVVAPKMETDVTLPAVQGELKTPDISIQLPSTELEVKAGHAGVKLSEGEIPEVELPTVEAGDALKGHLPGVEITRLKMPKVDLKGPRVDGEGLKVDVKGPQIDLKGPKLDMKGPRDMISACDMEMSVPGVEVDIQAPSVKLEGDLAPADTDLTIRDSKFKMPKFKIPSFGVSAPEKSLGASLEVEAPKMETDVTLPAVQGQLKTPDISIQLPSTKPEVSVPDMTGSIQAPSVQLEGDLALAEKDLTITDSKFKMPKFKMPSFGVSAPGKSLEASVEVVAPKMETDVTLPAVKGEFKTPDLSIRLPTTELEVSLPGMEKDIQAPSAQLEGDPDLAEKDLTTKDAKFKMPKFKMPSFGMAAPGKSLDASVEVVAPKMETHVTLPTAQGELKTPDLSIQLPSTELEVKAGRAGVKLPEGEIPEGELPTVEAGDAQKGHLPGVEIPSLKMPKVDLKGQWVDGEGLKVDVKGPEVDMKGPKLDMKGPRDMISASDMEMSVPGVEVDIQAPSVKLEGDLTLAEKELTTRDSKFKMPKFKMPSFGVSAAGKSLEASLEVEAPKMETDVTLPAVKGELKTPDLSIRPPSTELEVKVGHVGVKQPEAEIPEAELSTLEAGPGLKGHLPRVQMPSLKMPKVDLKRPQFDLKGSKVDMREPSREERAPELEMSVPGVEADIQAPSVQLKGDIPLAEKDLTSKDGKFKMPKFKMPSFGMSAPGKSLEASGKVVVPKTETDVTLPAVQGEFKTPDLSIKLPSTELEVSLPGMEKNIQAPSSQREGDPDLAEKDLTITDSKFKMPKFKMPSFGVSAPGKSLEASLEVEAPKLDTDVTLPAVQGQLKTPDTSIQLPSTKPEVSVPDMTGSIQAPSVQLEGDLALAEKDLTITDSKFKMPKFKMPSFGMAAPGKSLEASVEVVAPKMETDVTLPAVQGELKTPDISIQLPSTELEAKADHVGVKLPEGEIPEGELPTVEARDAQKGHLPGVEIPSLKMPKVDLKGPRVDGEGLKVDVKGPEVDLKGPKYDMKGPRDMISASEIDMSVPGVEVDIQAPSVQLEGDLVLAEKDLTTRDSKFKMPKFKMSSFGVSAPGKSLEASLEVEAPKMDTDVTLPAVQGQLKTPDTSIQLPSTKPEVSVPDMKGSIQAPSVQLEGDIALAEKDLTITDSKFKMPKFKMPSFGMPAPGKSLEASGEVVAPKMETDVTLPAVQGELKTPDLSIKLPSTELEVSLPGMEKDIQASSVQLEGDMVLAEKDLTTRDSKFKMPKFKMSSFGVSAPRKSLEASVEVVAPKTETDVTLPAVQGQLKTPDTSIRLPSTEMEVSLPGMVKDIQAPSVQLEGDIAQAKIDLTSKDSKFKMPKFKMPSFGMSAPGKSLEASGEVVVPKTETDVTLPTVQGEFKTPDLSIKQPSMELEVKAGHVGVKQPEGEIPEGELPTVEAGDALKGQLPGVEIPRVKMPKVDLKGPQVDRKGLKVDVKGREVDLKGPKLDMKGPRDMVGASDMEMSVPGVEVDIQAPSVKLEGDLTLAEKELTTRDSKFKMPKFKMPSFGVSAPGKSLEASLEVEAPKLDTDVTLPAVQGQLKTPDISIQLPSTKPEVSVPDMKGSIQAPSVQLEGDLALAEKDLTSKDSKFKMPKFKMPSFGVSAPGKSLEASVEVVAPKMETDVTLPAVQGELKTPDISIQLPSSELEVKAGHAGVKLSEGEIPEVELPTVEAGDALKGHLPGVEITRLKMPKVDLRGPRVDGEGLKVDVKGPQVDLKGPKYDMKGPRDMISASDMDMSVPGVEVDIQAPSVKLEGDLTLAEKELNTRDSKFKMPKFKMPSFGVSAPGKSLEASLEVEAPKMDTDVTLPAVQGELKTPDTSIQLPSTKPEVSVPDMKGSIQAPSVQLEGDLALAEKDLTITDSKFKMPKFKTPSFGVSAPGKSLEASVEVVAPKMETDVTLPAVQGEFKTPDLSIRLPSIEMEVSLPGMEKDIQAPSVQLEGDIAQAKIDLTSKDSKFKMPKFKMPSFGMSAPGKSLEASGEVVVPKTETDVTLPTVQGEFKTPDLSIKLPSMELEVKAGHVSVKQPEGEIPEGELSTVESGAGLKGHLPRVQMPSLKMPNVVLKGPQVDLKGSKVDMRGPSKEVRASELEVALAGVEVDIQEPSVQLEGDLTLSEKDLTSKDSKFKMPKFKMPSFGMSAPGKSLEASGEVVVPKTKTDVTLPAVQGEFKTPDLSIKQPSMELEVKAGHAGVKLSEGEIPEVELPTVEAGDAQKGHLPGVEIPSLKMPKVDLKGPQVDRKGLKVDVKGREVDLKGPKLDMKGPRDMISASDMEMSVPGVEVDIQAPSVKLEGDLTLAEKDLTSKDSKFKMPSFGVSAPGKSLEASLEVEAPKLDTDVTVPAVQGELKTPDTSIQLPSTKPEVSVPDMKGSIQTPSVQLEGDLALAEKDLTITDSKFKMPKFKMPSFGVSAPGKSLEASVEVVAPKMETDVTLPAVQGELKTPDISIQLPSTELEVKAGHAGVKLSEGEIPEVELPTVEAGDAQKGHVSGVEIPSLKMPKVDLKGQRVDGEGLKVDVKGPEVDLKGPKLDMKGPRDMISASDMEMSVPGVEVDIQAPSVKLEGDLTLAEKELTTRDSKFKMPKFKMPSFGVSAAGKSLEASLEMEAPKMETDVTLPAVQGELKTPDLSIRPPSTELDVGVKQPEGEIPERELSTLEAGPGLKGHLPRVQMPSLKMPKVDLKRPQVDLKGSKVDMRDPCREVRAPELVMSVPDVEADIQAPSVQLKGDIPLAEKDLTSKDGKFKMPKFKMPSFGMSAPGKSLEASGKLVVPKTETDVTLPAVQGEFKTPDLSIRLPSTELEVSLPGMEKDIQAPSAQLEGDPDLAEKDLTSKDSKFKMPKFKMPSFGVSAPGKSLEASLEVEAPKMDTDVTLPAVQGELKTPDTSIQLPSTKPEVSVPDMKGSIQAPSFQLEGDIALAEKDLTITDSKFKMPKFKMPSFGMAAPGKSLEASGEVVAPKMETDETLPAVQGEFKTPDLSIRLPSTELEVSLPGMVKDIQASSVQLEGDMVLAEKDLTTRDSKFKMPKFKMSSFGVSAPGKSLEASLEVEAPKMETDMTLTTVQGELKTPALSIQLPFTKPEVSVPDMKGAIQAPRFQLEGDLDLAEKDLTITDSKFKMPKFKMPSFGMAAPGKSLEASGEVVAPKMETDETLPAVQGEFKTPDLSIRLPSTELEVSLPGMEKDIQAPSVQLEGDLDLAGKALTSKDSKFKMPKFKMPSFGVSAPGKSLEASLEVEAPKLDTDVTLPAVQGELKTPDLSIQLPSTKLEVSVPGLEEDIQSTTVQLEGDIALAEKELTTRDSKFKMPKFKMPSFGVSAPGKSLEGLVEVVAPKMETDVTLPAVQGDLKTPDLSIQHPSRELEVKVDQWGLTLPEGEIPEAELPTLKAGDVQKGHLPGVEIPSLKMPKVDLKGPQVDRKGLKVDVKGPEVDLKGPKLDMKGPRDMVSSSDMEMSVPGVEVDIQAPSVKLEGDLTLAEKELTTRDSKFKMPKFKMPSFGVSAPGKSLDASVDVKAPEVEAAMALKAPDLNIQIPSTNMVIKAGQVGMKVPEGEIPERELPRQEAGGGQKGHLPRIQMPSFKMPKVDLKGPQVDLKGAKVDVKALSGEVITTSVEVSGPGMEEDIQAPSVKLEGDLALAEKDLTTKDGKFKMPKFKMPSFGTSVSHKSLEASVQVVAPKLETDMTLPDVHGEVKTPDLSIQLPSTELEVKAGQVDMKQPEGEISEGELPTQEVRAGLKGHLPRVEMPSLKMPKVDIKDPRHVVSASDMDMSVSGVEVDIQAPSVKLEGDLALAEKDLTTKDSKFKMPKFKLPSFGISTPGKSLEASVEVVAPKMETVVTLPAVQGDIKTPDLSIQTPSTNLEIKAGQMSMKLPEGKIPEGEMPTQEARAGLKGHLPWVQMPSLKMPKVDLKSSQVDLKGPKVDVRGPSREVRAPNVEVSLPGVEGDLALGDKDSTVRDSKFKMPKFKMPSFGMSVPGKSLEASVGVKVPTVETDMAVPSIQGDVKTPDLSIQLPSTDLEVKVGHVGVKQSKCDIPEGELPAQEAGDALKGHLPRVQMPSLEIPKVDMKGPQVTLKGTKMNVKGPSDEVGTPELEVSVPGMEVDIQGHSVQLEGDLALAEKVLTSKDSKFKMPKFKMPSFGVSAPGKSLEASLEVEAPKMDTDVTLPAVQGQLKTPDLSIQLPSTKLEVSVPDMEGTIQGPSVQLEGDLALADKDLVAMDSKFKMPSFNVSVPGKSLETSVGVVAPIKEADMTLLEEQRDLKSPDLSIQPPSLDLEVKAGQVAMKLPESETPECELPTQKAGAGLKEHLPSVQMPSLRMPNVDLKDTMVLAQGPRPSVPQGAALSHSDSSHASGPFSLTDPVSSVGPPCLSSPDDSSSPTFHGPVTFPKFHKPKFVFSDPTSSLPSLHSGDTSQESILPPVNTVSWEGSTRDPAGESSLPESQLPSSWAPLPSVLNAASTLPAAEPPSEKPISEGRGSSFKLPRFKLRPLSWSPKKEAEFIAESKGHLEDCTPSLSLAADQMDMPPGPGESPLDVPLHVPTEKEGGKGRSRKPSFSMPKLSLPKLKASKGRAVLPQADEHGGRDSEVPQTSGGDGSARGPGAHESTPEGELTGLHLPQVPIPSAHSIKPHVTSSLAMGEVTQSKSDLPLHEQDLAARGDSKSPEFEGVSGSQPSGEGSAPTMEDPLKLSSTQPDDVSTMECPEEAPTAEEVPTDLQERWFKMPKFHVPGFRRPSSKEGDGAGEQGAGEMHLSAASMPAGARLSPVPDSKVEAQVSLQPPDERANLRALESPTYADVVKRDLHSTVSRLHGPAVGVSQVHLPTPELKSLPAEGPLPLETPGEGLSEPQALPRGRTERPQCGGLTEVEEGTEAQGPVRLKASRTDVPAQVSVVRTRQLWEDSVLTVTFPKLKVPRFSSPSPLGSEALFFPVVRAVPATSPQGEPGLWGASLLKAGTGDPGGQPEGLDESLEASSVSKVRVHIQGSREKSGEVAPCSRERGGGEPAVPGAVSTHVVRASEIPTSTVQTPSYGFSLLKVKIPELPAQAAVSTIAPDSPAAAGIHCVPGALPTDTGEPFEMICTPASTPQQLPLEPAEPPASMPADSGSDDEPAEVLEFPDDSQEVRAPEEDGAVKEKPEGKKSSLLWSWLPSIGFSSVEETKAESSDSTQRPVPVHTQPGARPDPKNQEKAGWFRLPKLGFSSSPARSKRGDDDERQASQKLQEETVTFFDARETFSPEEEEEGMPGGARVEPGSRAMVTSSAGTEPALLEERNTVSGPVAK